MNILVTGSNGQLGSEFKKLVEEMGNGKPDHFIGEKNYYLFENHNTLDITDAEAVRKYFHDNKICICINCAAYTNVSKAEEDEENAIKGNVDGPRNLASACKGVGALLIHFSTDYVFDGTKETPYLETDETNPQTVYGKTKLLGEKAIIESGCAYMIFRVSWLYSEFGKNFVKSMASNYRKLPEGRKDIKVVTDQVGYPTYAENLAEDILWIIEHDNHENRYLTKFGIYNYCDALSNYLPPISWYSFTVAIFVTLKHLGVESEWRGKVQRCTSDDFQQNIPRPKYSGLDVKKFAESFHPRYTHSWKGSLQKALERIVNNNRQ